MNVSLESDTAHLESILESCDAISDRIDRFGITQESFCSDSALQEMLLFPLFQIGEHANHLSDELIDADKAIPWRKIIGLRHIIVHNYAKVDPIWAWNIFEADFNDLYRHVAKLFSVFNDAIKQGDAVSSYSELLTRVK